MSAASTEGPMAAGREWNLPHKNRGKRNEEPKRTGAGGGGGRRLACEACYEALVDVTESDGAREGETWV